ncbi:MAG: DEAD/DEAH box helicase [Desulfobacterales bacterium]
MKIEDIQKGNLISGIEQSGPVRIIAVDSAGENAVSVVYKNQSGPLGERMLFRNDEDLLTPAEDRRPWQFDAPGGAFKLGVEALRIHLAHLFDPMMAIHTSNVIPLPHQITAVYESMLPRHPLRFVLADDPGAGKTVMAGLYIRELMMRSDAQRILIAAPGGLVEQWQDELFEKFGLVFELFTRGKMETSHSGNPFMDSNLLIARMDQLSRAEDIQEKLSLVEWDLVVVDEAHKMSASYFGNKVKFTKRHQLGQLLSSKARHFLMMTATPHNGKETDFQLFLSLLDNDRFLGKFRDGVHQVDTTDVMRRMIKEDLVKFDGCPLFPERCAYTAQYELSEQEYTLYEAVTEYVKNEMNKAENMDGSRKNRVGFALTILQRRLASSPEAIYQSLKRRRQRLEKRVEEQKQQSMGNSIAETLTGFGSAPFDDFDEDELTGTEYENMAEELVDEATASQTIAEMQTEIWRIWNRNRAS